MPAFIYYKCPSQFRRQPHWNSSSLNNRRLPELKLPEGPDPIEFTPSHFNNTSWIMAFSHQKFTFLILCFITSLIVLHAQQQPSRGGNGIPGRAPKGLQKIRLNRGGSKYTKLELFYKIIIFILTWNGYLQFWMNEWCISI